MQLAATSLPLLPLILLLIQTTIIVAHKNTCKMSNFTVPIYSESNPTNVIRHDTLHPYNIPPSSANLTKPHLADNGTITLHAPPKTDLWRKPPSLNVSTAPTLYTRVPLRKFHSARVTVRSNWNTLYDQGGLALFLGPPPGEKGSTAGKWVKVGIEWVFGVPNVGTVAADIWADWSLATVPGVNVDGHQYKNGEHTNVTIEVEREVVEVEVEGKKEKKKEASLWVYKVDLDGKTRHGVREVTWVFEEDTGDKEGKGNTELWVGIYAARPTVPEREGVSTAELEREELGVAFENFQIRLFE